MTRRKTDKQKIIENLGTTVEYLQRQKLLDMLLESSSEEEEDSSDEELEDDDLIIEILLCQVAAEMESVRYLNRQPVYRKYTISEFDVDLRTGRRAWLNETDFVLKNGMSRVAVIRKLHQKIIKDHVVFKTGKTEGKAGGKRQMNTLFQLMTFLCYIRVEGNGMSAYIIS